MRLFAPFHTLLENKFYFDHVYERLIVERAFYRRIGSALSDFDSAVVDGAVNGVGRSTRQLGAGLRYLQNGQFQTYGAVGFAGVLFATAMVLILNPL
jgi:NADH-quinone oxidoreductase subunit L